MAESWKGFFINPDIKPAYTDIIKVVGKREETWQSIFTLLKMDLKLKVSLNYFNPVIGWVLEFSRSGTVKLILVPDKDTFKFGIPSLDLKCREISDYDDNLKELYWLIHQHVKEFPSQKQKEYLYSA